jgi:hypothetical protein
MGLISCRVFRGDAHHLQALVGVTPFVVIPGHNFDEGAIQSDRCIRIKHAGAGLATEVGGNDLVFGIAQHALQRTLTLGLHFGADFLQRGFSVQLAGQVDHGHVAGRHAERHAGELFVQRGDDHAHCLGSASAGGDDVFQNAAAAAPVFVGRAIHGLLRGGGGMHGGHQAALDTPLVIQHHGHGGQAVGGAACVGNDGLTSVGLVVHAEDEHGGIVLGGGRENDFLGTCSQVLFAACIVQEDAGRFDDDVGADFIPLQVARVFLLREANLLAIDHERIALDANGALEAAVHTVVLQHIGQILRLQQIVDGNDFDVREVLEGGAQYVASDAAKAVDAYLDSHMLLS